MSSLAAHIATGAAIYFAQRSRPPVRMSRGALACVALAVLPDVDYLAWWLLRLQIEPRVTHSLAFCAAAALLAWLLLRRWRDDAQPSAPLLTLLLAAGSHLLLDFTVGVHTLPLLWPVSPHGFVSPVGILPSAGRLSVSNFYLWRNLLIETGVVWPLLALLLAVGRRQWNRRATMVAALLAPVWLACLGWSISLQR